MKAFVTSTKCSSRIKSVPDSDMDLSSDRQREYHSGSTPRAVVLPRASRVYRPASEV